MQLLLILPLLAIVIDIVTLLILNHTFMKNKNMALVGLGFVFIAGLSFIGGIKYQQSKQSPSVGAPFDTNGQFAGSGRIMNRQTGNRMGFRPNSGEIISADANSITIKLQDGSSKIILLTSKTTINKATTATISELVAGERVTIIGQDNTDGSISAQSIQLNPVNRNVSPQPQQ